jgi:hypothetical protein
MQYDLTKPNPGRMFDYWLGGTHNFEIDRQFADQIAKQFPVVRELTKIERGRIKSIVRFFYEHGIRSIVDFGSSLPTCDNTHLVAHEIDPQIKVVYSDIDPVTSAYGQELLLGEPNAIYVHADAATPLVVLDAPETRALLGDNRRVGFISSILGHLLTDAQLRYSFQTLYDWAAPDSYYAMTVPSKDWVTEPHMNEIVESYRRANLLSSYRSPMELEPLLAPWKLTGEGIARAGHFELPSGSSTKSIVITYSMMLHKE